MNDIAARGGKPIAFVTMISHGLTDYSRSLRAGLPNVAFLQEIDKSMSAARSVIDYAQAAPCAAIRAFAAGVQAGPA